MNAARRLLRRTALLGTALVAAGGALMAAGPAAQAAKPPVITPVVNCIWDNGDGTTTAVVGYTSTFTTAQTIPVGANNYVTPNPADRGQPTVFQPGTNDNVWVVTVVTSTNPNWVVNGTPANLSSLTNCASKPLPATGDFTATIGGGLLSLLVLATAGGIRRRRRPLPRRRLAGADG